MSIPKGFAPFGRILLLLAVLLLASDRGHAAVYRSAVISRPLAARHGLERAWFTQVELDRSRSRIAHVVLYRDLLVAQTDHGVVHAIDAETGRTEWTSLVGRRSQTTLPATVSGRHVAVVDGAWAHVLDRANGRTVWKRKFSTALGAGPALNRNTVFIPFMNGRIYAYALNPSNDLKIEDDEPKPVSADIPTVYAGAGHISVAPLVTASSFAWPNDSGQFYLGNVNEPGLRFRVELSDSSVVSPAYRRPYFYVASADGYVYAINEVNGQRAWRFSAGNPIQQSPVVIGNRIFVCSNRGGMICLDASTGDPIWSAPHVAQFLAASPAHIYATDSRDRIFIFDGLTGQLVSTIRVAGLSLFVRNSQTDRIYVGTQSGLIQCLHERSHTEPVTYFEAESVNADQETEVDADAEAADEPPVPATDLALEDVAPADEPADEPAATEDSTFDEFDDGDAIFDSDEPDE